MDEEQIGNSAELGDGFLDACAGLFFGLVRVEDLASDVDLRSVNTSLLDGLIDLFLGALYIDVRIRLEW